MMKSPVPLGPAETPLPVLLVPGALVAGPPQVHLGAVLGPCSRTAAATSQKAMMSGHLSHVHLQPKVLLLGEAGTVPHPLLL